MRSASLSAVRIVVCLLPVLLLGCGGGGRDVGPTGEVTGVVTLDGEPLEIGSISFYDESTGNSGGVEMSPGGKFTFTSPIAVGKYKVSFQPPEAPPPGDQEADKEATSRADIPPGYQSGDTSGIEAEVKEGPNDYKFILTNPGPKVVN